MSANRMLGDRKKKTCYIGWMMTVYHIHTVNPSVHCKAVRSRALERWLACEGGAL